MYFTSPKTYFSILPINFYNIPHILLFILQCILLKYYKIIIIFFKIFFSHSPNHTSCRHTKPNTPHARTQPNHQNTVNPTLESTPRPSITTTDQTQIKLVNQIEIKSESNPLQNPLETHNQLQNPPQLPSKLAGNPQLASQPSDNPYAEQQPIPT